jgi:hypothetical protein
VGPPAGGGSGAGSAFSNGIFVGGNPIMVLIMPAAWDPAPLSFPISGDEGATWHDLLHASQGPDRYSVFEVASQVRPG